MVRHIAQTILRGVGESTGPLIVLASVAMLMCSLFGIAWLIANAYWTVTICLSLMILCIFFYWLGAMNR